MTVVDDGSRVQIEQLFVETVRPLIDRFVRKLERRYRLAADDADDLRSSLYLKFVAEDYRIVRTRDPQGALDAFVARVVMNAFHDYCDSRWGKWRPSMLARRQGIAALELERLFGRDRVPAREAIEIVSRRHPGVPERQLWGWLREFSRRGGRQQLSLDDQRMIEVASSASSTVGDREYDALDDAVIALEALIAELPAEDRYIIQAHCRDGASLATIARALRLAGATIYPRFQRLRRALGSAMTLRGYGPERIRELLGGEDAA